MDTMTPEERAQTALRKSGSEWNGASWSSFSTKNKEIRNVFSESGPDHIVDSTPLAGILALPTATASVVLPPGFSRGFVRATWAP